MIRCLAIDDEPLALQQLSAYITKVPFLSLVASCQSALDAAAVMAEQDIDAIFVDINMPDLNGMEFVRSLHNPPLVIFTTAYSEYAVEGYKVNAVDYLLKPFGMADIMQSADKIKRQYDLLHAENVSPVDADDAVFVKSDYKVQRLPVGRIVCIEGMGEYIRIYVEGQPKPSVVLMSMKKMEERLAGRHFMRIHKSYIINLAHVSEVTKTQVTMSDGRVIPIGDSYRAAFSDYIAGRFIE